MLLTLILGQSTDRDLFGSHSRSPAITYIIGDIRLHEAALTLNSDAAGIVNSD
jgi:hypothetical protein